MAAAIRPVARVVRAMDTSDGAGVRLRRSLGSAQIDYADPFLLLDEFRSDRADDYLAGFPDHPHRGFETVTYMLAGAMRHEDHAGNRGHLRAGSVQWMTAGRGIIHSEMPEQEDGLMWGFQLWVNLPAAHKMTAPRYQDIAPELIPESAPTDAARVRVIAGASGGVIGPVRGIVTDPLYLDVRLGERATHLEAVPSGHTALLYAYEGDGGAGAAGAATPIASGQLAVLGPGDAVRIEAGDEGLRCLLLAARPLGEPVARYGPFVMNTREEIHQAFDDYRSGRLTG